MIRIIALLLQALVAFAVSIGAQCRPERVGSRLADADALRSTRVYGAADGVVGAHTRPGRPARGLPAGVGVPEPTSVAASMSCTAVPRSTVAQAGCAGLHSRTPSPRRACPAGDRPPRSRLAWREPPRSMAAGGGGSGTGWRWSHSCGHRTLARGRRSDRRRHERKA